MGDQDHTTKQDGLGSDELDSLSSEEKAAFEKIMAEIGVAPDEAPLPDNSVSNAKQAPQSTTTVAKQPILDADTQGPSALSPTAQTADLDPRNTETEELTDDQQAALDRIMAEIQGNQIGEDVGIKATSKPEPDPDPEPDTEDLSDDQQAALNQIMAEIETKRKGEDTPIKEEPTPKPDADELSDDQQAALNQIMAEIETKRKPESPEPAAEDSASGDEPLAEDQQAALSQIMAEIESKKRSAEKVAEISANEAISTSASDTPEDLAEASAADRTPELPANLTMDEFSDELEQLLAAGSATADPKPNAPAVAPLKKEPLVVDSPFVDGATQKKKDTALPADPYPVLHEVQINDAGKSAKKKTKKVVSKVNPKPTDSTSGSARRWYGKPVFVFTLVLTVIAVSAGGYWGYRQFESRLGKESAPRQLSASVAQPHDSKPKPVVAAPEPSRPSEIPKQATIPSNPLALMTTDLLSARDQIQTKIFEIEKLKSFYAEGIQQEAQKIEQQMVSQVIPDFQNAMSNKVIDLVLRSIQRRQIYMAKLETPLAQLSAVGEEFLFLERQIQLYAILSEGISGLPISALQQKVTAALTNYQRYIEQLSIDDIQVPPPALDSIWKQLALGMSQKADQMAQRTPLNKAISQEICQGNFERKFMLTALSADTARCLIQWSGKDLYLNELSELPVEVAPILSRWPGEWLSLNGLKTLSAEAAKSLAQWPGQRLSLNGVIALSPEATQYLSKWKGAQLEMVGLESIGSWENYGTRLFLSEKLRRQLELQ